MAEASKCPHCGKPVPPGAPGGLCPECMVKVGIGSEAGSPGAGPKRPAPSPPSLEDVARHFPQLEILELLGSGGMGAVYKARQREIDRLVALKILPLEAGSDPGFAERFTREARALAKLSHPNIVALHEFGHVDGLHYFMMEFVDGLNLRQLEQAGRLSAREALQIIPQICEALQFAHDEGIVHRDIKPENVLLDKKGRVKIADFGLARILGHEPEDFRLTRPREVMGTPHYMAPEQVEKPQSVDHRADIFSLGVVFYEMLTGELPLGKFAPPSQKVQIDVRLDEVVLRALEKEPARRYQHASEVKTDMETIMTNQPAMATDMPLPIPSSQRRATRLWRVAVPVGALLTLAAILLFAWFREHTPRLIAPEAATVGFETTTAPAPGVAVSPPVETNRWYYVSGEVRAPSRRLYDGHITLLQAITSAGDFTDFADQKRVKLTHGDGSSQIVNCTKAQNNPRLDPEVSPGDTIFVRRRLAFDTDSAAPATGTTVDAAQREAEALRRRYGLERQALPTNPPTIGAPPQELFARRYGLAAPPAAAPPGNPDPAAAFAARYGLGGGVPASGPSATNANFNDAASATAPLSYQWRFGTNGIIGATTPGPAGLIVTKLTPLYLKLTLESVVSFDTATRYVIGFENEAAASPRERSKRQYYCSLNASGKQDIFNLREAKAPPDYPTNATVILELKDSGARVELSKDRPFQRVDGYMADLRYEPEHKAWTNRRVGSALYFGGDEAQIIAITRTEVVIGAKSSGKTWAVEFKGTPADQTGIPGATPK